MELNPFKMTFLLPIKICSYKSLRCSQSVHGNKSLSTSRRHGGPGGRGAGDSLEQKVQEGRTWQSLNP